MISPASEKHNEDWQLAKISVQGGLLILIFLLYLPCLQFGFFSVDDPQYVSNNLIVLEGLSFKSIWWALRTNCFGNWAPLTWASHILDSSLFGEWAGGHRFVNLFLHALATLLCFSFFRRLGASWLRSFLIAVVLALHPANVEAVVWVASRKDLLNGIFTFLSLIAYLEYAKKRTLRNYGLVLLCVILGLASKPSLVMAPLLFLLLDYWPLRRIARTGRKEFFLLCVEKIPFIALSIIIAFTTFLAQNQDLNVGTQPPLGLLSGIGRASYYLLSYAYISIWPNQLSFPYAFPELSGGECLLYLLLVVLISVQMLLFGRRRPALCFAWFFFMIEMLPYLQFSQIGRLSMSNRWLYVASTGLFFGVFSLLDDFFAGTKWLKRVEIVTLLSLVFCLFDLSERQITLWSDGKRLFGSAIALNSNNALAYSYLAGYFERKRDYQAALEAHKKSYELLPSETSFSSLLTVLDKLGRAAEAVEWVGNEPVNGEKNEWFSLQLQSRKLYVLGSSGISRKEYQRLFQKDPFRESIVLAEKSLGLHSREASTEYTLALAHAGLQEYGQAMEYLAAASEIKGPVFGILSTKGVLLYHLGRLAESREALLRAIDMSPNTWRPYNNLAAVFLKQNEGFLAAEYARKALRISEDEPGPLVTLGNVLIALQIFLEAENVLRKALQYAPNNVEAMNGLGVALYHSGDMKEAEFWLRKAHAVDPEKAMLDYNLGMVLLAQDKKEEGKQHLESAVKLDSSLKGSVENNAPLLW